MKKLLALFLALFLLLALFGACSTDTPSDNSASLPEDGTGGDTDGTNEADSTGTDSEDNTAETDQPREYDEKHIEWMGVEVHQWKYDFVDAEDFNSWQSLM